ncbi:MAG: ribbon-helix-helix protein, CopG family, partial [Moorea sp. SIO3I7]|nr:ribbon-helix-helix protein, CopG family [Moorena sp. SIO3I7]
MAKKSRKTASQYSESKSKVGISLTPTGIGLLTQMAQNTGLSRSELIERIARGNIAIACQQASM